MSTKYRSAATVQTICCYISGVSGVYICGVTSQFVQPSGTDRCVVAAGEVERKVDEARYPVGRITAVDGCGFKRAS